MDKNILKVWEALKSGQDIIMNVFQKMFLLVYNRYTRGFIVTFLYVYNIHQSGSSPSLFNYPNLGG
jgi:hypothetical protein